MPGSGSDADAALFRKGWAASERVGAARGSAADYGRRLYGAVAAHGLIDLGADGRVTVASGGSPAARVWRLTTKQVREALAGTGVLSEQELERYIGLLADPGFAWLMPTVVAVWGRRPAP